MAVQSRYLVGIDLGTTHTVVAYADTTKAGAPTDDAPGAPPPVETFEVEQLVAPGEVAKRSMLPSLRYHPSEAELAPGDLGLPWAGSPTDHVVGELAGRLGAKVPGRLVASAKSWLSHSAVDRSADILPWGAPADVAKVSPVEASASYLRHLRANWDERFPKNPLHTQEVVLTVPASFDEGARALTLEAAKRAGLRVRLVEEPQAAFYAFLDATRDGLEDALGATRLAVIVDVGGGTTDLTLIQVEMRETGPRLTRVAVGEHLMLGGDNMDLTLARLAEERLGRSLDAARFNQLVQQCRLAKERLLSADAPESADVTVLGSGRKLVGGALKTALGRDEVRQLVLDGFFPEVDAAARPSTKRGGIVEFGLPYVSDAGITRHVAAFLARHEELAREALGKKDLRSGADQDAPAMPDAVLFNGGVFGSPLLRERMQGVLGAWRGGPPTLLENGRPELAVARGAVAYGLARRGLGLRIGGGSARSYFLLVDRGGDGPQKGVCILPRGSEEGEEVALEDRTFQLRVGRPVRFHVASTTADVEHVRAGQLVSIDDPERYQTLPPIAAVLTTEDDAQKEVPVSLVAQLTEIGTLEVGCVHTETGKRWQLELSLRGGGSSGPAQRVGQLHSRFAEATALVDLAYGKPKKGQAAPKPRDIKRLRVDLEKVLGPRDTWDTPLLRELFGALLAGLKRRRRSADHERMWFHLVGWCMRPGFGYPLDEWRVEQLAPVLDQGVQFAPEAQNWSEFWTLWRRLAGGLPPKMQTALLDQLDYYLQPPMKGHKKRKRPDGPKKLGYDDMVRLAGALERVPPERKAKVGGWLVERLDQHDDNPQTWWAVGRLGSRVPFHGSAHQVVPRHVAAQWLEKALTFDFRDAPEAAFAATLIARRSGNRERDLAEDLREGVAKRLEHAGMPASWVSMVREVTHLDAADERRLLGDSLPPGLRLVE